MGKSAYIACAIVSIFLGITLGIIVHVYNDEKIEKATIKQVEMINSIKQTEERNRIVQTSTGEEKTSPNTNIIFETYYNKCGHSKIENSTIDKDDVNKTENEIKEKYSEWNVKSFSGDKIELYKEENSICDNHFIVKENNGYVSVYSIDEDGIEILKEQTEIFTQYLPKEDIDLLRKGIKANSNSQLEQILSDYE